MTKEQKNEYMRKWNKEHFQRARELVLVSKSKKPEYYKNLQKKK